MDADLRQRLETFLRPLYQDLDGVSRIEEVERIAQIALRLYDPPDDGDRHPFELLLLFHRLGRWLDKIGNISRVVLASGGAITHEELRRTAASIRQLAAPSSESERAVAAAVLIDGAGLRGLAEQLARARREGRSIDDIARDCLGAPDVPDWVPDAGQEMLRERLATRREFCRRLLEEGGSS